MTTAKSKNSSQTKAVPKRPASHTYTLNAHQGDRLRDLCQRQGFEFFDLEYGFFSARKGKCSVSYYHSGKVVIQGKDAGEFIQFHFEPQITGEARLGYEEIWEPEMFQPHFGIDEAGKGDFFGPLVIAGTYVEDATTRKLLEAGIRDSKRVSSDARVKDLADQVRQIIGDKWSVVSIGPSRYNDLYQSMGNLNRLLAWGHGQVLSNLSTKVPECPRALSDQFAHKSLVEREAARRGFSGVLQQRPKAESDLAVAAASILAREAFVSALDRLTQPPLPKGAGAPVKQRALEIARNEGVTRLEQVSKVHFKTFSEVCRSL